MLVGNGWVFPIYKDYLARRKLAKAKSNAFRIPNAGFERGG